MRMVSFWNCERTKRWLLIFLVSFQMCGTQRNEKMKEWWCYCKDGEVVLWASWKVERGGKGRRLDYHEETSSSRCSLINMCFGKWGQELQVVGDGSCSRGGAHDAWWLEVNGRAKKKRYPNFLLKVEDRSRKGRDVTHPQIPWKTQMQVWKWKK
jgi:hypothetical protein